MSTKATFALALTAGFLGGIVSQRIGLPLVYAQAATPIPTEIRAQSFVVVDSAGKPRGAFGIDPRGGPMIEITDSKGHALLPRWVSLCLSECKPTLVPPQ
jgi:hypothetical protein